MDLQSIVSELKQERDRLDRAIAALDGSDTTRNRTASRKRRAKATMPRHRRGSRKGITAAGRKRLSKLMKRRWAERRKKAANGRKAA